MIYKIEFVTLWETRYKGLLVDLELLRLEKKKTLEVILHILS